MGYLRSVPSPTTPKRSRSIVPRLLVSVGALLLSLVLLELLVRAFVPVRNIGLSFTEFDPYYGKRIKTSLQTTRSAPEFDMTFTSNSLGFRGPEPEGHVTDGILFLGDSFTMGYGVTDGREYPQLLGRMLEERVEMGLPIVNTGMGGNGNGRWVKLLARDAARFEPRLVVLAVMANDFWDNEVEGLFTLEGGELQELPIQSSFMRRLQPWIDAYTILPETYLFGLLRQALVHGSAPWGEADEPSLKNPIETSATEAAALTYALIEESLRWIERHDFRAVGLSIELRGEELDKLHRLFARYEIDLLRIPSKSERPDLYFKVDGHWNEAGHRYAAETLFEHLAEHPRLLEPPSVTRVWPRSAQTSQGDL